MPSGIGPAHVLLLGTKNADGTITGVSTGTGQPFKRAGAGIITIVGESVGTTSGGIVLIEEAALNEAGAYNGTWSLVQTMTASDFTGTAQKAYHLSNSAIDGIRARVSSTITGGGTVIIHMLSQSAG